MALSVMGDAPVLMKVANPSSQDRTPRGAIVLAVSPAAANYRASGLVHWRKADVGGNFVPLLEAKRTYKRHGRRQGQANRPFPMGS